MNKIFMGRVKYFFNGSDEYMVKRLKKRPLTSTSIFDFYGSNGPQTPPVKTIKLISGKKKV